MSRTLPPLPIPTLGRLCGPGMIVVVGVALAASAAFGRQDAGMPIRLGPPPAVAGPSSEEPVGIRLNAIEADVGDRGPLDSSLRWVEAGLRLPAGYDQVYRLEGGDLMRADGGLVATFMQSIYQQTRFGPIASIPASTLFIIGGVPMGAESGHGRLLAVDPLDPGAVPSMWPATATPDAARPPQAKPGDRLRRFGFGDGFRVGDRVGPDPVGSDDAGDGVVAGSRFTRDPDYRASRLAARLDRWREDLRDGAAVTPTRSDTATTAVDPAAPPRATSPRRSP